MNKCYACLKAAKDEIFFNRQTIILHFLSSTENIIIPDQTLSALLQEIQKVSNYESAGMTVLCTHKDNIKLFCTRKIGQHI